MNYQRVFVSPTHIRITIPGGFPYESFDNSGRKINSWSLLQLVESCRAFSFWPVSHASRPNESYIDAHKLLTEHYFFIVSARTVASEDLFLVDMPKYPLVANKTLEYVGKTSFCLKTEIGHSELAKPYITSYVQTVLVNPETRKPVQFPKWWKDKYSIDPNKNVSLKINSPALPKNSASTVNMQVTLKDVDSYGHTNWISYIRFCEDAYALDILKNYKGNFKMNNVDNGLKQFDINFKGESLLGEKLDVITWDNPSQTGNICCVIKRQEKVITDLQLQYF